jgi:hypothetical protein
VDVARLTLTRAAVTRRPPHHWHLAKVSWKDATFKPELPLHLAFTTAFGSKGGRVPCVWAVPLASLKSLFNRRDRSLTEAQPEWRRHGHGDPT